MCVADNRMHLKYLAVNKLLMDISLKLKSFFSDNDALTNILNNATNVIIDVFMIKINRCLKGLFVIQCRLNNKI